MFAVIAFLESDCVEWVPVTWLATSDDQPIDDIRAIILNKATVKIYWPPTGNPSSFSRARNRCMERELHWQTYSGRVLGTAGKLECVTLKVCYFCLFTCSNTYSVYKCL